MHLGVRVNPCWVCKPALCSSKAHTSCPSLLLSHPKAGEGLTPPAMQLTAALQQATERLIPLEVRAQLLARGCWRVVNVRAGKTNPTSALKSPQHWKQSKGPCSVRSYSKGSHPKIKMRVEIWLWSVHQTIRSLASWHQKWEGSHRYIF